MGGWVSFSMRKIFGYVMGENTTGILSWNIEEIVQALKINAGDVREYFTDGRRVSFLLERRLAREVLIRMWWGIGQLGTTAKISRQKALDLLGGMIR